MYIPNYSNSNWLMILLKKESESETKNTKIHPKSSFLFQLLFHCFGWCFWSFASWKFPAKNEPARKNAALIQGKEMMGIVFAPETRFLTDVCYHMIRFVYTCYCYYIVII